MLACLVALWPASAAGVEEGDPPEIVNVAVVGRPSAGRAVTARVTYRAQQGNVVAVIVRRSRIWTGRAASPPSGRSAWSPRRSAARRASSSLPLGFATPGRRRVTFTLVTDEREESDPASIDVDVAP